MTTGRKSEFEVRIGLERQVRIVLEQDGIETIAVYRKRDEKRIAARADWPSLTLPDETWRKTVEDLALLADMIVLFWGLTSPGMAEELAICDTDANRFKTVAVSNVEPRDIFLHQLFKVFPRFVPLNEIPPMVGLHPEFTPLIDRMKDILHFDQQTALY